MPDLEAEWLMRRADVARAELRELMDERQGIMDDTAALLVDVVRAGAWAREAAEPPQLAPGD